MSFQDVKECIYVLFEHVQVQLHVRTHACAQNIHMYVHSDIIVHFKMSLNAYIEHVQVQLHVHAHACMCV